MIHIPLRGTVPMLDGTRIAEHHGVWGHIDIYKTVRGDEHVVADGDLTHNGCVDAYPHSVANNGAALAHTTVRLTDHYTFVDVAVAPYPRPAVDGDVIGMA